MEKSRKIVEKIPKIWKIPKTAEKTGRITYLSGDISSGNGKESNDKSAMKENGPDDGTKEVIEVGKEQIVQFVTSTRNVAHVSEEHESIPKVV